mmetsp:Transcript_38057/g.42657  ORF Transcript_38057/g.42657 Transcript_38057/m.42657 type:complete len:310 (-) Transcript_38057:123-1052(-)
MTVDEDKLSVARTRTTRSNATVSAAFAAFAIDQRKRGRDDDSDSAINDKSAGSGPDRKKQNKSGDESNIIGALSVTTITEDDIGVISALNRNMPVQATPDDIIDRNNAIYGITNPLLLNIPNNSDINEDPTTLLPPIKSQAKIPTNNSMTAATFTKKLSPIRDTIIADSTIRPGRKPERKAHSVNGSRGYFLWFVCSCSFTFIIMLLMIWCGMLLNQRALYQLESLEYRERLQQIYHEIGIPTEDLDFNNNNIGKDIVDEHRYYWQELEAQVKYWKKEAKKFQLFGDGYKDQCNDDLRKLLQEIAPPQP